MKGAVIYARYSCERQTEQSIEGQLRECYKYAEQNGLTIIHEYIDRAMTGTNDNRPSFQKMLADAERTTAWDIVLVYALDRFGRNSIEIALNKQKLIKSGKTLISATQRTSTNIDGSRNLDGILLENMYIGLAEYYSAELSQKIKRGLRESRLKGQFGGGGVAYGYKVVNKKLEINEEQAQIVKYIFERYYGGKIVREIIEELTARGVLYKNKPFVPQTVYKMLVNEKYIGITKYNGEVFDNIYPPIIDKSLFDAIQKKLAVNKTGKRSVNTTFLLRNTPDDIHIEERYIVVNKQMQEGKTVPPKTEAGIRNVPILDNLYPYLKDIDFSKHDRLFPIKEHALREHFQNALKASGLDGMGFTIHSLRHTYATRCAENDVSCYVTQKWVGHSTPDMTQSVYTHVNEDFEKEEIAKFNKGVNDTYNQEKKTIRE